MYRLLIVDDEEQIVDWLYELFRDETGLELEIFKAYSAYEAVELLNKTKFDIVLSDIYMPGMDGIQLLKKIQKNWPNCRVIFLSGHRKFEYALEAINHNCVSYILKTEDDDVIISAVKKAVEEINKSHKNEELIIKAKKELELANPILQKEFLAELLFTTNNECIYQSDFDDLHISLNIQKSFFLIIGKIEGQSSKLSRIRKNEISISIKLMFEKYLEMYKHKIFTNFGSSNYICLVQPSEQGDANNSVILNGAMETIQAGCKETIGTTMSFIISDEITDWSNIAEEYSKLKQILSFATGISTEMLLTPKNFEHFTLDYSLPIKQAISKLKRADVLSSFLETGDRTAYFQFILDITNCLKTVNSLTYGPAVEIYFTLATKLISYINRTKFLESIAFKINVSGLTSLEQFQNWDEAIQFIIDISTVVFDSQKGSQVEAVQNSIQYIKQYIGSHLNEDLSLTKIADISYFNPSYLSRLFKQETGVKLSDYIMEVRINKAKELLKETNLKIFEIALMVGLESSTYFGRVFKKYTNETAQEYRERFQKSK